MEKKAIFMTVEECLEIFKKYDNAFYEYWKVCISPIQ